MSLSRLRWCLLPCLLLAAAAPALANPTTVPVWRASPLLGVIAVLVTLLIEYPFVARLTKATPGLGVMAAVLMNLASAAAGAFFTPTIHGALWKTPVVTRGLLANAAHHARVNEALTIVAFVILLATVVEIAVLAVMFSGKLKLSGLAWLLLANALSFAAVWAVLLVVGVLR